MANVEEAKKKLPAICVEKDDHRPDSSWLHAAINEDGSFEFSIRSDSFASLHVLMNNIKLIKDKL